MELQYLEQRYPHNFSLWGYLAESFPLKHPLNFYYFQSSAGPVFSHYGGVVRLFCFSGAREGRGKGE